MIMIDLKERLVLDIDLTHAFRERYKMRPTGRRSRPNIGITIPPPVVHREAERRGLTLDELVERCAVVVYFGQFPGIYIGFEEIGADAKASDDDFPVEA
jgi:hypothetical protein